MSERLELSERASTMEAEAEMLLEHDGDDVEMDEIDLREAAAERRLVRKLDLRILPVLCLLYLCACM
jgi:hypothetical protein